MTDSAKQILKLYNLIKKYKKEFKGDKLSLFIIVSKLLEQIGEIANREKTIYLKNWITNIFTTLEI